MSVLFGSCYFWWAYIVFTKKVCFVLEGRLEKEKGALPLFSNGLNLLLCSLVFYFVVLTPRLFQNCYVKKCAIFIIQNIEIFHCVWEFHPKSARNHHPRYEGYFVFDTCPRSRPTCPRSRPTTTTTIAVTAGRTSWLMCMYTR